VKSTIALPADPRCRACRGHGYTYEYHGSPFGTEKFVCCCVLDNAPTDAATQAAIDRNDFEVVGVDEEGGAA